MNKNIYEYIKDLKEQINNNTFNTNNEIRTGFKKDYIDLSNPDEVKNLNLELNKLGLEIKSVKDDNLSCFITIDKI